MCLCVDVARAENYIHNQLFSIWNSYIILSWKSVFVTLVNSAWKIERMCNNCSKSNGFASIWKQDYLFQKFVDDNASTPQRLERHSKNRQSHSWFVVVVHLSVQLGRRALPYVVERCTLGFYYLSFRKVFSIDRRAHVSDAKNISKADDIGENIRSNINKKF